MQYIFEIYENGCTVYASASAIYAIVGQAGKDNFNKDG